ncbi:MAG: quinoprotein relay system zinc metallohydrolase 2 [Rhodanobacter sp.]|nr:quinoprotein relay system zinc metallohydrolase 2 [Rhodanobacter sp.]
MKRLRRALLAITCLLSAMPAMGGGEFALAEVAPGVFVHAGKPLPLDAPGHDDIANIGFIVGSKCVAVIDTGGSLRIGRALRAAIQQRSRLPVCYVIDTHVHVDHVLGNAAFKADKPSFIGSDLLTAALVRSREFFLKQYAADFDAPADAAQIVAPDRSVAPGETLSLDLGERHLQLRAWPKSHTDCDLTVFDDKTRTLWTGDLLFVQRLPALDGSVKGWLGVIDELLKLPAPRHIVPGHGAVGSDLAAMLAPERAYLRMLEQGVRAQIAAGKPMDAAIREVGASEKGTWLLWGETHPHNVARVYQELEWE